MGTLIDRVRGRGRLVRVEESKKAFERSMLRRLRDDSQVLPCLAFISGEAVECGRVR